MGTEKLNKEIEDSFQIKLNIPEVIVVDHAIDEGYFDDVCDS